MTCIVSYEVLWHDINNGDTRACDATGHLSSRCRPPGTCCASRSVPPSVRCPTTPRCSAATEGRVLLRTRPDTRPLPPGSANQSCRPGDWRVWETWRASLSSAAHDQPVLRSNYYRYYIFNKHGSCSLWAFRVCLGFHQSASFYKWCIFRCALHQLRTNWSTFAVHSKI